jgi:hypothetical protein
LKNAYEHRDGDIIIKLRTRKARICYVCESYSHEKNYCSQFNKPIREAKEAVTCEGYECIFKASKVYCSECKNLSYGYYCEILRAPAPYPKRAKECNNFKRAGPDEPAWEILPGASGAEYCLTKIERECQIEQ